MACQWIKSHGYSPKVEKQANRIKTKFYPAWGKDESMISNRPD